MNDIQILEEIHKALLLKSTDKFPPPTIYEMEKGKYFIEPYKGILEFIKDQFSFDIYKECLTRAEVDELIKILWEDHTVKYSEMWDYTKYGENPTSKKAWELRCYKNRRLKVFSFEVYLDITTSEPIC